MYVERILVYQNEMWVSQTTHPHFIYIQSLSVLNKHCRTAGRHHQHAAVPSDCFKVQVHSYYRIGPKPHRILFHFAESRILGFTKHLFVRVGTPTDYITHTGKKVTKQVRANNRFTRYDSIILCDSFLFDIGSRCCSIFIINLVVNTLKDKVCICKF